MRVVISICKHELEMAEKWFSWVCELGGTEGHSLHLIPSSGTDIKGIFEKANRAFHNNVSVQIDYEAETSDWQNTEQMRSASGPNSSFRQVAWDFYHFKKGPFFWCELDCIPTKKDWLNRLEAEYKLCGKPFMGAQVQIEGVPEHMSGNAVYPQNVPEEAPTLVMRADWIPKGQTKRFELAFDVAGAKDVIPKAHWTNLIQHKFRFGKFESREHFDSVIDPNAVVFHSCKDGSIFKYLRENLSGIVSHAATGSPEVIQDLLNVGAAEAGYNPNAAQDGAGEADEPEKPRAEPVPSQSGYTVSNARYVSSDELKDVLVQNSFIVKGIPPMSPPWEDREESERDVQMLCGVLSLFCKSPVYKGRVRNALREAKIIK